jgi:ABC-type transport system substrate-binding protein
MPYYGNPIKYEYDPAKATALLKEAGCYPVQAQSWFQDLTPIVVSR